MKVSISNGELLDKVTIIKLKMENIKDPTSRDSVRGNTMNW